MRNSQNLPELSRHVPLYEQPFAGPLMRSCALFLGLILIPLSIFLFEIIMPLIPDALLPAFARTVWVKEHLILLLAASLLAAISIAGLLLLLGPWGRLIVKSSKVGGLIFLVGIMLAGGYNIGAYAFAPHVNLMQTGFSQTSVLMKGKGQMYFHNPSDGIRQVLCIGVDQQCTVKEGAPQALNRGVAIEPGEALLVFFPSQGTFSVTSKTRPHMNITLHVQPRHSRG